MVSVDDSSLQADSFTAQVALSDGRLPFGTVLRSSYEAGELFP